jgi:hypothetical protein
MGRSIRSKNKVAVSLKREENKPKKKPAIKDYMQYKIATQVRVDAAFIRAKKG